MGDLLSSFYGYIFEDKQSYGSDFQFPACVLQIFVLLFGEKSLKIHSILLSFTTFCLLFIAVNMLILPLVAKYRKKQIAVSTEMMWTQNILHIVYGMFIIPLSFGYLYQVGDIHLKLSTDVFNSDSLDSILILCIITGFTIHEMATLMAARQSVTSYFNRPLFLQDLIVITCACMLLVYDQGHYLGLLVGIAMEGVNIMHSVTWLSKQYCPNWLYKASTFMTLYLCSYCSLLGIYCLYSSYRQMDSILNSVPMPLLVTLHVFLLLELLVVIPFCSMKLMEKNSHSTLNKKMKIMKIPNGVYRLNNIRLAQLQNSGYMNHTVFN